MTTEQYAREFLEKCGYDDPGGWVCRWLAGAAKPRRKMLCIVGSMRFYDVMLRVAADKTLQGWIVLMPFVNLRNVVHRGLAGEYPNAKAELAIMHMEMIDIADLVYVVNPGDYVGEDTTSEIRYAMRQGKPVDYFETPGRREVRNALYKGKLTTIQDAALPDDG